jgi:cellulose synthase/poly-beta-1,6-N-acetylglucosamine synthase-like glycosyltransferase
MMVATVLQGAVQVVIWSAITVLTVYAVGYYTLTGWALTRAVTWLRSARPASSVLRAAELNSAQDAELISVVLTAHNEAPVIEAALRTVLAADWTNLDVVVVADGPTDGTFDVLQQFLDLEQIPLPATDDRMPVEGTIIALHRSRADPRVRVLQKESAGTKADAANAGLRYAVGNWVVVADGDQLFSPDTIGRCYAGVTGTPGAVCAGVTLLPANGCSVNDGQITVGFPDGYLAGSQTLEYMRSFIIGRSALAAADALSLVSGGFGMFHRASVLEVGGYQTPHMGEDLDLTVRLRALDLRDWHASAVHVPDTVVWTQVPDTWKTLGNQRRRWELGLRQVLQQHSTLVGARSRFTRLGLGYLWVYEFLAQFAIIAATVLVWLLVAAGVLTFASAVWMVVITWATGVVVDVVSAAAAVRLLGRFSRPRELFRLWWLVCVQQLMFAPFCLWCRLTAHRATGWQSAARREFATAD